MQILGLVKTTLLDFPEHVACTAFLGGCNFVCPFCQNASLVLHPNTEVPIPIDTFWSHLNKRCNILEGVCITGGEPTLNSDLTEFIKQIKSLGLLVKLDTNGSNPTLLKHLIDNKYIDYVAMDIKNSFTNYGKTIGIPSFNIDPIKESINLLLQGTVSYEFRTTVVKELHTSSDFEEIAQMIKGASNYYLQCYQDSGDVIQPGFTAYTYAELENFQQLLLKSIPKTILR